MKLLGFAMIHMQAAEKLALMNYNEERRAVALLPPIDAVPDLTMFAENGLGVAAFENGEMLGFLGCLEPWENAFGSAARGTFSPIHAHGAIKEGRGMIYKRLYQAAAEKWVKKGITYHAIGLYAHDGEAIGALFSYGFGLRCIDAIRAMEGLGSGRSENIAIRELSRDAVADVRDMRQMLMTHLGNSPCFMDSSQVAFDAWIARAEKRNSRIFTAECEGQPIAFVEVQADGENFITEASDMLNICGAFCLPAFRGSGVAQAVLDHAIAVLQNEGYTKLGVDFESFNPTASGFWLKYFTAYTKSVVRRIDECAVRSV